MESTMKVSLINAREGERLCMPPFFKEYGPHKRTCYPPKSETIFTQKTLGNGQNQVGGIRKTFLTNFQLLLDVFKVQTGGATAHKTKTLGPPYIKKPKT